MGRIEMHAGFWWGNVGERDHLEDEDGGVDVRITVKWMIRKYPGMAWSKSVWRSVEFFLKR
jgi:hypothetical protein